MKCSLVFWQRRSIGGRSVTPVQVPPPPSLTFRVTEYSTMAIGGSDKAKIEVTGARDDVYALLDWTRYGVDILDVAGTWVWGGYIRRVEVRDPVEGETWITDLDTMYNEVAIAYTLQTTGDSHNGQRDTTDFLAHTESVREFGRRQLIEPKNAKTLTAAENARYRQLYESPYPTTVSRPEASGGGKEVTATLELAGWWYTLEWLYCNIPSRLVLQFETIGTTEAVIGLDNNDDALNVSERAQQFKSGPAGWDLVQAACYIKRVGTPPAALTATIYDDDDGKPGSSLGSGDIASANVGTAYSWQLITLSSAVTLAADTTYWVSFGTSGLNQTAYYVVMLDEKAGYADGVSQEKKAAWGAVSSDLPFRLYADTTIDTAQQVRGIIAAHGQFFMGIDVHCSSGIVTDSFQDGDIDALRAVEDLMELATTNHLRLLAEVTRGRVVRIYEEPARPALPLIWRNGQFYNKGYPEPKSHAKCGFWAVSGAHLPSTVSGGRLSGITAYFVEKCTYYPDEDRLDPKPLVDVDRYDLIEKG